MTLEGNTYTAIQESGHIILGSSTLRVRQVTTLSSVQISAASSGIVFGSKTVMFTAMPMPSVSVVAAGSMRFTESPVSGVSKKGFAIDGTTISVGGPEVTVSGVVVSQGSTGLELVHTRSSIPKDVSLAPIVSLSTPGAGVSVLTAGSVTITAADLSGTYLFISLDGTTLSHGGAPLITDGVTVTEGSNGLVMLASKTTAYFRSVDAASKSSSSTSPPVARSGTSTQIFLA